MNWQDLVCAACSGRVAEGRCATCRAARERFTARSPLPAGAVLLAALALMLHVLLLQHLS